MTKGISVAFANGAGILELRTACKGVDRLESSR